MTGEIKPGRLALHCHKLLARELRYVRQRDGADALAFRFAAHAEKVELPGNVFPAVGGNAVDDRPRGREQRPALEAERIKRAGLDERFHGAAVQIARHHPAAEFVERAERAAALALGLELFDEAPADTLDGDETEADILTCHGEVGVRLVHVRRQELYAHVAALGDILGDLRAVVEHAREQRRHILARIVAFHIRRAVGDEGVGNGVCFIEGVVRKINDLVVNAARNVFRYAVGDAAGNVPRGIAVDEGDALGVDDGVLFLAHGAADDVRLTERVSGKLPEHLLHLLLIDHTAVGDAEDRLELRVLVADLFRVLAALKEFRDAVHRAGAVERDNGGDIFERFRPQRGAHARDARRFELKYARGLAGGKHIEHRRIVHRDGINGESRLPAPDELCRVLEHREVAKPQKVHFQQTQLFERRHRILRDGAAVVRGERDIFVYRPVRDDDAGGVGGGVARHALERTGGVDEVFDLFIALVHVLERLGELESLVERYVERARAARHLLGDGVGFRIADVQRAADVADGHTRGHCAERDDLRDMVGAVLARHIVDDLAAAAHAEVHVDIGHAHALRV